MKKAAIAIDLGGTKCAGAVFTEDGKMLHRIKKPLGSLSGKAVGDLITEVYNELTSNTDKTIYEIKGTGVSVPGISYQDTGKVWAPNIEGWEEFPLYEVLLGTMNTGMKIIIDSDRACSILGEQWKGSAKNCRHAIFLAVGTGIGAGILVDGKVLRGRNDIAGAIGWLAIESAFLDEYQKYGCFEFHASGDGLTRVAEKLLKEDTLKSASDLNRKNLTTEKIFDSYDKNDFIATEIVTQAIRAWGKATANLVSLFNPEIIIFGGGVFGPAIRLIPDIYDEAVKWAQPVSIRQVQLKATALGSEAALYGAASLIFNDQS